MKHCNLKITRTNWFGIATLVLTFIIGIGWQCSTHYHTDDFFYRMAAETPTDDFWALHTTPITSFSQLPVSVASHWLTANGRLSNTVYMCVQPLPHSLLTFINGFGIGCIALLLLRFGGRYAKSLTNPWLVIAVPLLMWTGLQWNDQLQSADFQFNYTLTSVMMLGLLLLLERPSHKLGPWGWVLLVVFALWHEGFCIIFGVFLGVQWLFTRRKILLPVIGALIIGVAVVCLLSPGSTHRMATTEIPMLEYYPFTLAISRMWPAFFAVAWWLIRRRKLDKERRRELDRWGWGIIVSIVVAFAVLIVICAPQRSHWPVELLSICLIIKIISTYSLRPGIKPWIAVPLLALYALWGYSLVKWQIRVTNFAKKTYTEVAAGKRVFADTDGVLSERRPFWLMDMTRPQYGPFNCFEHYTIGAHAAKDRNACYVAVPPALEGTSFDSWPKLDGNNDVRILAGQSLVRRHDGHNPETERWYLTFGDPTISTSPLDRFISLIRGSGKTFTANMMVSDFKTIVYQNDTIDILFFQGLQRTAFGRELIAVDVPDEYGYSFNKDSKPQ